MTTEVILKRELLGSTVSQKSKTGYFSATDLFRIGNKWRAANGLNLKVIDEYNSLKSTKEFEEQLSKKYVTRVFKRGRGQHLWVHPLLFIDMALYKPSTGKFIDIVKEGFYTAGGEIILYPNKMRSIQVRGSIGIDISSRIFKQEWRTKRGPEIEVGIGLFY